MVKTWASSVHGSGEAVGVWPSGPKRLCKRVSVAAILRDMEEAPSCLCGDIHGNEQILIIYSEKWGTLTQIMG